MTDSHPAPTANGHSPTRSAPSGRRLSSSGDWAWKECPICGETFHAPLIGRPKKFCSDACRYTHRDEERARRKLANREARRRVPELEAEVEDLRRRLPDPGTVDSMVAYLEDESGIISDVQKDLRHPGAVVDTAWEGLRGEVERLRRRTAAGEVTE